MRDAMDARPGTFSAVDVGPTAAGRGKTRGAAPARQRGYSLAELLTVVSILGVITLIAIPALFQLMPQYRIRGAASELASTMRMARQKAITTRNPWRVVLDPANDRYAVSALTTPGADITVATNWTWVDKDWRTGGAAAVWRTLPSSTDLRNGSTTFNDVVCPAGANRDVVFLRDGSLSNAARCGVAGSELTFATLPAAVVAVNNTLVRYNRYYLTAQQSGIIQVAPRKE